MNCPYCGKRAMPLWRKCTLSPDQTMACVSCGRQVSVPWAAIGAAAFIAAGIVGAVRLPMIWAAASFATGIAAYVAAQRFVVPLAGREP